MNAFTVIFLVFVLGTSTTLIWLAQRQRDSALRNRDTVPPAFHDRISLAVHQKAADYTAAKMRLEQIDTLIGTLLALIWTLGGGLNLLAGWWENAGWDHVIAFGFNRSTVGLYLSDALKQAVLSLILGAPLLALLLWLIMHTGQWWWLYGWLAWMAFTSAMMWLYPTWIAPLFNRFSPLEDEALRERIVELLRRCGFANGGIFVMDGSKRSQHGNAYFTGFGANKRIVFFDTLLKSLQADEIEAVLAHELGHFKHGHVRKRLLLMSIISLSGFALLGILLNAEWFYTGLGLHHPSHAAVLLLFLMIAPYFTALLRPLSSYWMRKHEFEADDFAAGQTDARNLITALVKLYKENAATLTPDTLYSAYHDSHPPAPVRISHLATRQASPSAP